jgi:rod shape-determining protein MreD
LAKRSPSRRFLPRDPHVAEPYRLTPQLALRVGILGMLALAVFGAVAGFSVGLLADTGVFGTLGFTALLLTLAGYWTGRYGETTGRDRAHAPVLSIAVITVLYQISALVLRYLLGEPAPASHIFAALAPTVLLNLILTVPVYALTRRLLRPQEWVTREVRLLG